MAVPIGSFTGVVIFGGFTCRVASFRVANVGLRGMWTCLVTCRKSFCVAGAILLRRFQNMRCTSRAAGAALQTCRVAWFLVRTRRKTSLFELQRVKIEGRLARNARFDAPKCLV